MNVRPVIREGLNHTFGDSRSLAWHLGWAAVGPLVLALSWTDLPPSFFTDRGQGPSILATLTLVSAVFLYATAGGFSLGSIFRNPVHPYSHWRRYTPVGPVAYLNGRVLHHLIHTASLVLMIFPALMLAGAGSYLPPGRVFAVASVLLFSTLSFRLAAEAGRRPDRPTGSLGPLLYIILILIFLLLLHAGLPGWSLVETLRRLTGSTTREVSPADLVRTLGLQAAAGAAGYSVALLRLRLADRVIRASS